MVRKSQHGSNKGKSCLTNLFAFQEAAADSVDKGRTANVVYLDFSMVFSMVYRSNPGTSLGRYRLHQLAIGWWLKNCVDRSAQRVKNWQHKFQLAAV